MGQADLLFEVQGCWFYSSTDAEKEMQSLKNSISLRLISRQEIPLVTGHTRFGSAGIEGLGVVLSSVAAHPEQ